MYGRLWAAAGFERRNAMHPDLIQQIAEEKIRQAQREGAFDDLPGAGSPLPREDESMVPPALRMGYKILKNSGYVPPEVQEQKEISTIRELIEKTSDESEKYRQIQKLNMLITRVNMRRTRPVHLQEEQVYFEKVVEKVRVKKQTGRDTSKTEKDNDRKEL
jgi:hypothetical protein